MGFDNMLANGQAEASATRRPAPALFNAVEALEDARLVFGRDARAVVSHGHSHAIAARYQRDYYLAVSLASVFYRIVNQIDKYLANTVAVGYYT